LIFFFLEHAGELRIIILKRNCSMLIVLPSCQNGKITDLPADVICYEFILYMEIACRCYWMCLG